MEYVPATTLHTENGSFRASSLSKYRCKVTQAKSDDGERPADETTSVLVIKDVKSEARTRGLGTVVSMKQR